MTRSLLLSLAVLSLVGCDANEFAPFGREDGGSDGAGGMGGEDGGGGEQPPKRECGVTFRYNPGRSVAGLALGGEFNQWKPESTPMTGPDANGDWTATVAMAPGAYGYKVVIKNPSGSDEWLLDTQNPYTKFVDGVENSLREVDDCKAPLLRFVKLDRLPGGGVHAELQYVDGADQAGLDRASLEVLLDGASTPGLVVKANGLITIDGAGLAKDKHRLTVRVADKGGRHAVDLHVPFWIEDQPFDFRDGLLYFVFTDRFRDGKTGNGLPAGDVDPRANYAGGDFQGVIDAIEVGYFEALGVRTLWLSPPNANPDGGFFGTGGHLYTGYHGYWPSSGRDVQKRFGNLALLKKLVQRAHAHGLRVIVDSVLNHVHKEHPLYQAHQHDGWFNGDGTCVCQDGGCGDWKEHALDCWFTNYLPDLDYRNFEALSTMIADAEFWAREVDVDGFRVDAVKHFLLTATKRLRSKLHDDFEHAGPLFYLVGETFDGDHDLINGYMGPQALHAQFDFPIYFQVRDTLANYSQSLRNLEKATRDSDAVFGDAPMSPFLGNHDVPRFLTQAAGQLWNDAQAQAWSSPPLPPTDEAAYQKLQLGLTFVAASPGVPLVYYGDEFGLPGAADPDNRRFMKWDGYSAWELATLEHTRKLGQARAELTALRRGNRVTMWIDDNLYVFARVAGNDTAVVVINREWNPRTVSVPVAPGVPLANGTVLTDRLGGAPATVAGGALALTIAAHSSAVLAP